MIQIINSPENVAAFRAVGEVTKEDYETIVVPTIEALVKKTDQLNFLLELDTELASFTAGAWWEDLMIGIKNFGKWNRSAIVTNSDNIITFTNGFSFIAPGEYKGFKKQELDIALLWVSAT
ncbi:STAS/SEC14 domain-containing protein [Flavobacterium sp.]|uniref:STAS/SEC14 domain-containing protein n=1 Tax=Flavobacterium sp. TaxID=239 RepID=UPI00248A8CE1|nr:STAS/SEC14 domain-containing protein [Flavobacterium sp.]MDI1316041.1 STAS/SEC14 domain-containing protein [Flavobacterium sp.]